MLKNFQEGEPAPDFTCKSLANDHYHFSTAAGRYIVLFFFKSAANKITEKILMAIHHQLRSYFNDDNFSFFGVSTDAVDAINGKLTSQIPGIRYFIDEDLKVSHLYGAFLSDQISPTNPHRSFTLILDPLLRVITQIFVEDTDKHIAEL